MTQPPDPEAIRPFQIAVPQDALDDLKGRLARTRFPDEIRDGGWDYGANLALHARLRGVLAGGV